MKRTLLLTRSERDLRAEPDVVVLRESDLPASQMRTCAHCGSQTTFELQDSAGWYACSECGRFA